MVHYTGNLLFGLLKHRKRIKKLRVSRVSENHITMWKVLLESKTTGEVYSGYASATTRRAKRMALRQALGVFLEMEPK